MVAKFPLKFTLPPYLAIILVTLALLVFIVALFSLRRRHAGSRSAGSPEAAASTSRLPVTFGAQTFLLSKAERSFFGVLHQEFAGSFHIFGKVRLADLVKPLVSDGPSWWTAFNKLSSKHVDFVLCEPSDLRIVCCIELDDASHDSASRQKRDTFVDQCLASAGIPLVRFPAAKGYIPAELREKILLTPGLDSVLPRSS